MRWPFYVLALALPFELPKSVIEVLGFELTVLELIAMAGLGLSALALARRGELRNVTRAAFLPLLVAFLAACLLSSALAEPPRLLPFKYSLRVGAGLVTFALASAVFRRLEHLRALLLALALSGTLVGGIAVGEALNISSLDELLAPFRDQDFEVGGIHRVAATFSYPNTAAGYLVLLLPAGLYGFLRGSRTFHPVRIAALLASAIMFLGVLLTYSRGALLGALAVPAVLAAWSYGRRRPTLMCRAMGVVMLFLTLCALTAFSDPFFRLRAVSEGDASWYRAEFRPRRARLDAEPGELLQVPISVRNRGRMSWQPSGPKAFHLSYHWYDLGEDEVLALEGERTRLPGSVEPGSEVSLLANVRAPDHEGSYLLVWDMVQEHTTWFVGKGAGSKVLPVVVSASGPLPREDVSSVAESSAVLEEISKSFLDDAWFPGRLELWSLALKMFLARPLTGVGPDNFRWLYGPMAGRSRWDSRVFSNSLYLETLATTGLLGGLAFFGLMASAVRDLWRAGAVARDEDESLLAVVLAASLAGFLLHGVFDFLLEFTSIYLSFYLVLGAASALTGIVGRGGVAHRKVVNHACWV